MNDLTSITPSSPEKNDHTTNGIPIKKSVTTGEDDEHSSVCVDDKLAGEKRKRNCGQSEQNEILNESSTIDDLATVDAATYIAWVNRQSQSLPSVFVADQTETNVQSKEIRHEEPIDGSAATIQVFLSNHMAILPPPTVRHLPPINRNTLDDVSQNDKDGRHSCSQWISNTISNFSELRTHMEQVQSQMTQQRRNIAVPRMKDRAGWHVFCLGKGEAHGNVGGFFEDSDGEETHEFQEESNVTHDKNSKEEVNLAIADEKPLEEDESESQYRPELVPPNGYPPTVPLLLQFDQVLTRTLFHHHVHFFCEWKSPLTRNRASWIYALLARMEKPWHREECSAVRKLLRECCARRWELSLPEEACQLQSRVDMSISLPTDVSGAGTMYPDEDTKIWEVLALLNDLIAITGVYYEQGASANGDVINDLFSVPNGR